MATGMWVQLLTTAAMSCDAACGGPARLCPRQCRRRHRGAASLAVRRSLETLLYGLEPDDPATLAAAAGVLLLAGVGAGLAAAVPAVRVEPSRVLRQQ